MTILSNAVKIADKVTKSLKMQAIVQFRHFVSETGDGERTYNPPITDPATELRAIVDFKQMTVRMSDGSSAVSRAYVMFLDKAALLTATSDEGVLDQDLITLPDGTTGPILTLGGFIDDGSDLPVATEVYLG